MKKALIIYSSSTGNTAKVANAIQEGLAEAGVQVTVKKPEEAPDTDFFNYDLVCVGTPSIQWHPAKPIDDFLKNKLFTYRSQGRIKPSAPKVRGKHALVFVTYSGPHTGLDEATPAGKYIAQFFEHVGFTVLGEWYILSEYHGNVENSTLGRMGDIRGKPNAEDLQKIIQDAKNIADRI
jgi:flavorubredoxin